MNKNFPANQLIRDLSKQKDLDLFCSLNDRERFSKDFYDYSPVLVDELKGCLADLVVRPHSLAAVLSVAGISNQYKIPLTLRGSGTGNYGQCVPLQKGIVMLMSSLKKIRSFDEETGDLTVESGCLLRDIDEYLSKKGRQLRLSPSTWRSASIGGFVAGGSGGVGSVRWGFLRDPGHLQGLEIVTNEDSPRVLQLDANSSEALNHSYGTNGIITALKISTANYISWQEVVVDCPTLSVAVDLINTCTRSAIDLNLATLLEDKIVKQLPNYYGDLSNGYRLLFLVSKSGVQTIKNLANKSNSVFKYFGYEDLKSGTLMREITWNHTTLHMRSKNSEWTYLQMLLPQPELGAIESLSQKWGSDLLWHLEAVRQQGVQRLAALPLIKWKGYKQLQALINDAKEHGAIIFNPHVVTVEDGGLGVIDGDQVKAKSIYDPNGLLNPGKLKGWILRED